MRILRSQYLKLKSAHSLDDTTATKTTTLTAVHDETPMRRTRMTSKAIQDVKSIQTVTQATRTRLRHNSVITSNAQILQDALLYAKNNLNKICPSTPVGQSPIQKRRQTLACVDDDLLKQQILDALKIKLINTPIDQYTRINVVVRFYDEGTMWYTRFYRSYEDVLWLKIPRGGKTAKTKWHFKCEVCQKKLCSFRTLKSHLNIHMGFFPYRCEDCPNQYPARGTYVRHRKSKH
ncbi:uncharacterized protein [Bactrocera oleae]|uniref:uncharacterized protein n=1 Tax=Bactrocera oleae TaxID=104688 RepID=UPI0006B81985|nr:uncharacterized protein LOC106627909 [Bactrocera oleae]XP_036222030.1 uncharacterized protein LOC106627909 [Bactrocera oleae]